MQVSNAPRPEPDELEAEERDPLARFRSWRGFLLAALAVNVLFAYAMVGLVADAGVARWYKALIWLPFNTIATAVYYAIMMRLFRPGPSGGGLFYVLLCSALIVANWVLMFAA